MATARAADCTRARARSRRGERSARLGFSPSPTHAAEEALLQLPLSAFSRRGGVGGDWGLLPDPFRRTTPVSGFPIKPGGLWFGCEPPRLLGAAQPPPPSPKAENRPWRLSQSGEGLELDAPEI